MKKAENIKRIFSLELKLELVKKIERGELRVTDVCKTYGVSYTAVYKWLRKYSELNSKQTRVVVENRSIGKKNKELKDQIKELEQALGQKQMPPLPRDCIAWSGLISPSSINPPATARLNRSPLPRD